MKKALKITAAAVAAIVFVAGAAVAVLTTYNWNRAKPWINEKVTEATERSFEISGDLSLDWRAPVQKQQGLFGWLPWPHLRAYDIRLGNPEWSTTGPYMARIRQMDFPIDIWPLLHKTIRLPSVLLTEPDLILERDKGTKNNWVFPKRDARDSKWQLDIQSLGITHGTVRYVDPQKKADVMTHLDTLADGSVKWSANGRFNAEKLSGEGQAGALLSLQSANVKYPVKASLKVGETTITADGTLTNPAHFSALDVNLKILGASMSDLFPISGIVLPSTPKFSTEGHLSGTIVPQDIRLHYEKFKGQVGTSDLEGSLEYMQKQSGIPRALLRGKVASNRLNFSDLAPVIGAGSAPEKRKKKEDAKLLPGRVLPVEPFKTDRWSAMDIQVEFTGRKIIRQESMPIDDLYARINIVNGVLSLAPLKFGVAGGRLSADINMDGKRNPAAVKMKISARGLKLNQLFPSIQSMKASIGVLAGDAQLSASGNSIAAILATSNGEVKALISEGTVSKFLLEAAGLNIGSVVVTKLFGDKQVPLNCMAADFGVNDGLMKTRTFVVDTKDATILVDGDINFATEKLDLTIHPESKGLRVFSLRSPLYVKGTFKNPDTGVDKGKVALKAGAAALLGTVAAPAAALLALINPGGEKDSPCARLLATASEKPVAPAPPKGVPTVTHQADDRPANGAH